MKQYDAVVIGAGISGLSLASYTAGAGLETLILEQSSRSGGCFHSHRFPSSQGEPFWLELGAHTCYNSYGGLIGIMERHGLMGELIAREKVSFKMLVEGEVRSISSQLSFPELFANAWRLFSLKKDGESVASYYGRIVGAKNYRKVFGPAFNAVISQRADDFPADMLFNKRPRRKEVLKSFTLQGGLSSITDRISRAPGLAVRYDAQVTRVAADGAGYAVELADGTVVSARRVVVAAPPPVASRLCADIAPELSRLLGQIRVETIETVGVAVPKGALKLPPMAGIIAASDTFYSAVSRDTVPHEKYRGFSFHFKAGKADQEGKLRRIAEVLGVERSALSKVVARESRLPSPVVGHHQLTAEIDRQLEGKQLFVAGNYFAGMAIEDCVVRSRKEFERLSGQL